MKLYKKQTPHTLVRQAFYPKEKLTWGGLFDLIKKYFIKLTGVFIVITFSFYVESKREEYETRMTYAGLLNDIVQELHAVQQYTDQYLIHNEQIKQIYRQQLRR